MLAALPRFAELPTGSVFWSLGALQARAALQHFVARPGLGDHWAEVLDGEAGVQAVVPSPAIHAILIQLTFPCGRVPLGLLRKTFSGLGCLPGAPRSGRWFLLVLAVHIDC